MISLGGWSWSAAFSDAACGNTCNFRPEDTQNFTALDRGARRPHPYRQDPDRRDSYFHSPLFDSPSNPAKGLSSDESVRLWLAGGTPPHKLVMGVPFYGRGWTGVHGGNQGLWQSATGGAPGTYEVGVEDYKVLVAKRHPGFYHPDTKSFWTFNGTELWSYDTPTSLGTKTGYIKSENLGGAMFWELSGDTADGELVYALSAGLK